MEEKKVCTGCENNTEEESFAMALLRDYSKQAKRWFVVAIVELALILSMIGCAVYLIATTEITHTELNTQDGGHANYINDSTVNDINNGEDTSTDDTPEK